MVSDLKTSAHKGCKIAAQKKFFFPANFAFLAGFFWYRRCYYPRRSRDSLSPVCGIFDISLSYKTPNCIAYFLFISENPFSSDLGSPTEYTFPQFSSCSEASLTSHSESQFNMDDTEWLPSVLGQFQAVYLKPTGFKLVVHANTFSFLITFLLL